MGISSDLRVLFLSMVAPPQAREIMSPCISVCKISQATGLCLGCYRSLDEIAAWSEMNDAQRKGIMDQLSARALGTSELQRPAPEEGQ
ncbi:MAG: DUF1289 domain-containing protein [Burkholderiaceae bacterium]|nr:DUF1289 domain-containing protein [Burkholderiaceae bacterium]